MVATLLLASAVIIFVYMTLSFVIARARKRLDTVDTAWGLGFVVIAWAVALQTSYGRNIVIAILVTIWGVRLADHIWQRSKGRADDPRYAELSNKWKGNYWARAYGSIFLLQGALIWLVGLPLVTAAGTQLHGSSRLTLVGALIWLIGFGTEAIADRQLATFLARPQHPKVLRTGLWRYSRHPNYFGELTQWWGIGIIASQARYGWVGLLGPLVLSVLVIFVSGIPPIERRRLKDPEYQSYRHQTSRLVPLPPRRF